MDWDIVLVSCFVIEDVDLYVEEVDVWCLYFVIVYCDVFDEVGVLV